jgi:hypothetical protein
VFSGSPWSGCSAFAIFRLLDSWLNIAMTLNDPGQNVQSPVAAKKPSETSFGFEVSWFPDGKSVAFTSDRDPKHKAAIFRVTDVFSYYLNRLSFQQMQGLS